MSPIVIALMGVFVLSTSVAAPIPTNADSITQSTTSEARIATLQKPETAGAVAPKKVAVRENVEPTASYKVALTAYNAVPEQTDGNPFVTASGAASNPSVVMARSVDLAGKLPFGTIVKIERTAKDTPSCNYSAVDHLIGYRVIADSMNTRISNTVDVLLDQTDTVTVGAKEMNPSRALGYCSEVTVSVVGHINTKDIPDTQSGLVRVVEGTQLARN
jgi:3D (Asp-Asp-Asp) domain-containing protein